HAVLVSPSGLITLTGGKWTTYRLMAEQVIDRAIEVAGLPEVPCPTETLQLHGYTTAPASIGYGTDALQLATLPGHDALLNPNLPYTEAMIRFAIRHEAARTIEDILARCGDNALVLALDQVSDPHNVGAILRSAAAFGAAGVIVTDRHTPSDTGTLAKSASGALEVVPLVRAVNLARTLDQLKEAGFWTYGLAESGDTRIGDLDLKGRTCIVLGAEGEGLRRLTTEKCDRLVTIPTSNALSALNVSNAAAVAAYEWARQRPK
ncbi:MAG: TrmH family RNA methyltransferase, partial [Phenylobacterium sp.]|nr:TrmH family RNA methyltransferase [Phenylobacterium sp.]